MGPRHREDNGRWMKMGLRVREDNGRWMKMSLLPPRGQREPMWTKMGPRFREDLCITTETHSYSGVG